MLIRSEKGLSMVVKCVLDLLLIGGTVILLSLPVSLKWYFNNYLWTNGVYYGFLSGFLLITGISCLMIVYELRRMLKTLNEQGPFRRENVNYLRRIATLALLNSAMFVVKTIFYISIPAVIITIIFLLLGLFALILSEVFNQAINVKEENDLTI